MGSQLTGWGGSRAERVFNIETGGSHMLYVKITMSLVYALDVIMSVRMPGSVSCLVLLWLGQL